MTLARAFGQVLRAAREQQAVSQEQLAFDSNCHRTYIGLLERGIRAPSLGMVFALAAALGMSPAEMVGDTERLMEREGSVNDEAHP